MVYKSGGIVNHEISTNKQDGQIFEFLVKEGKWFNNIYGVATSLTNLDTSEISVQGLGTASSDGYSGTPSYTLSITDDGSYTNVSSISTVSASIVQGTLIPDQTITITHATGYPLTHTDITINGATVDDSSIANTRKLTGSGGLWAYLADVRLTTVSNNVQAVFDFNVNMGSADVSIEVNWD